MIKIIRKFNKGTYDKPEIKEVELTECTTREEAKRWIKKAPKWLKDELEIKKDIP